MELRREGMRGLAAAALVALTVLAACATRDVTPPPEEAAGEPDRGQYVIGPADVLRVQVWKNPELSTEVPVRPDGKISVPLVNDVQAAGLTAEELKETLTQALSEYVSAPDVTVIVSQINSKVVYVVGEVLRPSAVSLNQDMRALDAIAVAGGFSAYADRDDIKILRRGDDGAVIEYRFDYDAFLRGAAVDSNLRLRPGDTIVVPD